MKVAIVGSRTLWIDDFSEYLPEETTEIISGGAKGIDSSARSYALKSHIPFMEYRPDYQKYGRCAPLIRNDLIVERADLILAFWDGSSSGTAYVIKKCRETNTTCRVYIKDDLPI